MKKPQKKILVALSGGVDSAVSVLELQKAGFEVIAVHFKMFTSDENTEEEDAKKIANQLEVKLVTKNISEDFQKEVLDNFVEEYRAGRTPNPCTLCNKKIKFNYLLKSADELGVEFVATGHYACIVKKEGQTYITKAKDKKKDQSYFLYRLGQKEISRIIFPLCSFSKDEVWEKAKVANLKIPSKESQDVCFIKNNKTLKDFLSPEIPELFGNITSEDGEVLGRHSGATFYTIGQRRGLNIGGRGPFYVVCKNLEKNELVVTSDKGSLKLNPKEVIFEDVSWAGEVPKENKEYLIKTRYLASAARARISRIENGRYGAQLIESQWAVAPGQSLVVFDKNLVMGGGVIVAVN